MIPTPLDLRNAILFAKKGKACGPDALPAEIGLSSAEELQRILFPLALKLGLLGEEGVGHKSGGLTWLYKGRGSHTACEAYRGILLLSTLSKAIHRSFRPQIQTFFEQAAAPTQLGGRRGGSVLFGSHAMRSVLRSAWEAGRTSVILFADMLQQHITPLSAAWPPDTLVKSLLPVLVTSCRFKSNSKRSPLWHKGGPARGCVPLQLRSIQERG